METTRTDSITEEMSVLDIISTYPETVMIFGSYDEQVGECICCQMLFATVRQITEKYNLNLTELLEKLNATAEL